MIKNITPALVLSLLVSVPAQAKSVPKEHVTTLQTEQLLERYGAGFASLEHKNMGDMIRIYLPSNKLTLPNGIQLSYGELVMYAGDLFGDPKKPISSCTDKEKQSCFEAQFNALAVQGNTTDTQCTNPLNQIKHLVTYMNTVESDLNKARQQGINDWEFYSLHDETKPLNKITCGGSIISGLFPFGSYLKLARVNYDHFAPDSVTAYTVGHQYALNTALRAYQKKQQGEIDDAIKLLELAYAQNAFANHYLTDSFSSGHMRVPRRAIAQDIMLPKILNLLIANIMHDEDNEHGLNVVNAEGSSWIAYGDNYLYRPEAEQQRGIMLDAMQRSADSIYQTFNTGILPKSYSELDLFPVYSKINELNDTAPLFKVEDGVLLKRVKNHDVNDHHWTKYWSGLVTLMKFKL